MVPWRIPVSPAAEDSTSTDRLEGATLVIPNRIALQAIAA
jgi:hypothetical protein